MTPLTLVLLIDAFRHDYVERTRVIRDLAAGSARGRMREDFGFVPRAAYFGGLTPEQSGFTNMYCCDRAASPFGPARGLPASRFGRDVEERFGLRSALEAEARQRVTPFAARYLSTAEIPLDLLPHFALAETRAPWDPAVGYRSIFHDLDASGMPHYSCAWPDTNALSDSSDAGLVRETLRRVKPSTRFAFVHLQALDAVGHAYGPESPELAAALDTTDALVGELLTELRRRHGHLDVMLFGDHGMVPVTGTVDVWSALSSLEARPGQDYVFFLDSTMARFWFHTASAKDDVIRVLSELPGRVLDDQDLARLQMTGCDPRNGELIFLVPPGLLVMPNFFQRRGQIVRGMHGYEPDCPDNQGALLVSAAAGPAEPSDLGVVGPTEIYRRACGLLWPDRVTSTSGAQTVQHARTARTRGSMATPTPASCGPFIEHPDPAAHATVAAHLTRTVEALRRMNPAAEAILLTGSFGRGEGGVSRNGDGGYHPVNDYDVLLVSPDGPAAQSAELRDLGASLASEFGTDFVHISRWTSIDPDLPLTLANYDVRYGSRVLWGDAAVLERLPRYAASDIPPFEGLQLLFNRLAGLLSGLSDAARTTNDPGPRAYLVNQTMKALMALGDWRLFGCGAYDSSYRRRLERFAWLADGLRVPPGQRDAIVRAYAFKLRPDEANQPDIAAAATEATGWLVRAVIDGVGPITRRRASTAVEAAAAYYDVTTLDAAWASADNAFAARTLSDGPTGVVSPPQGSVRQHVYASLLLIAASLLGDAAAFAAASTRLRGCLMGDWPVELSASNWESVRSRASRAWLTLVH